MERPLTVGQLVRATAIPAKTIRYYEQVGVLPVADRSIAIFSTRCPSVAVRSPCSCVRGFLSPNSRC
jgi:MerR HTH family regulatory protein